jgi:hypothetical protein
MKATNTLKPLSGTLRLAAYSELGEELWRDEGSNLIVAEGYRIAAAALAGAPGAKIDKVAVGSGSADPAPTDTQLTGGVPIAIQSCTVDEGKAAVTFHFKIGYLDANGIAIREFGLLSSDGRLFARKTRKNPIAKTAYVSIVGDWEIRMGEPQATPQP